MKRSAKIFIFTLLSAVFCSNFTIQAMKENENPKPVKRQRLSLSPETPHKADIPASEADAKSSSEISSYSPTNPPSTPISVFPASTTTSFVSPASINILLPKYCKNILAALSDSEKKPKDVATEIKKQMRAFFATFPYTASMGVGSGKKKIKKNVQDVKQAAVLTTRKKLFFQSMFLLLCKTLIQCCSTIGNYINDEKTGESSIAFENKKANYIVTFNVAEQGYVAETSPDKVIYLINNHEKPCHVIDVTLPLDEKSNPLPLKVNYYKRVDTINSPTCYKQNTPEYLSTNFFSELIADFNDQNQSDVQEELTEIFNSIPATWQQNAKENFYKNLVYCIAHFMGNTIAATETSTAKGRIDIAINTGQRIIIIETKLNKTTQEALNQIGQKKYAALFENQNMPIILWGINIEAKENNNNVTVTAESQMHTPSIMSPAKKGHRAKRKLIFSQP